MLMLSRRLQVLVDDERLERLEREAARRKVAVAVLVREALDAAYPNDTATRRAAGDVILSAEPMAVPDPGELREELRLLRERRA
jgi:hypothetical protein